jgi:hypothetical protein
LIPNLGASLLKLTGTLGAFFLGAPLFLAATDFAATDLTDRVDLADFTDFAELLELLELLIDLALRFVGAADFVAVFFVFAFLE